MLVKKIVHKIIDLYKRQNHIKYAKSLGVKVGEDSRFVDNPIWQNTDILLPQGSTDVFHQ